MVFYALYDACVCVCVGAVGYMKVFTGHHNTHSLAYEVYRESRRVDVAIVYMYHVICDPQ